MKTIQDSPSRRFSNTRGNNNGESCKSKDRNVQLLRLRLNGLIDKSKSKNRKSERNSCEGINNLTVKRFFRGGCFAAGRCRSETATIDFRFSMVGRDREGAGSGYGLQWTQ